MIQIEVQQTQTDSYVCLVYGGRGLKNDNIPSKVFVNLWEYCHGMSQERQCFVGGSEEGGFQRMVLADVPL